MNFSASRFQNQPPERGSFPLDHDRACTPLRDEFLACLKAEGNEHVACRALSERYLACRMDKNLMARDAMENIGFGAAPAPMQLAPSTSARAACALMAAVDDKVSAIARNIQSQPRW